MKIPKRLRPLVDDGLVDEVVRPLMSGKEAAVYVVRSNDETFCAKVYKEATNRNFRQRADYQEGRTVRNSRRGRAMAKRSKFGKSELEDAWQNAEVDALYKLAAAGVRVPKPHMFSGGVLLMELVTDKEGNAAPRLNDRTLTAEAARRYHAFLINQIVRMLCANLIHGDLSEYNVLIGEDGPVIIDLPQAVDAAGNKSAKRMLLRDVDNMAAYFGRFVPELNKTDYGNEIWKLYERGELVPEAELTGKAQAPKALANLDSVLREIEEAREEHHRRFGRKVVDLEVPPLADRLVSSEPVWDSSEEDNRNSGRGGGRGSGGRGGSKKRGGGGGGGGGRGGRSGGGGGGRNQSGGQKGGKAQGQKQSVRGNRSGERKRRGGGPGSGDKPAAQARPAAAQNKDEPAAPKRRRRRRRGDGGGQSSPSQSPQPQRARSESGGARRDESSGGTKRSEPSKLKPAATPRRRRERLKRKPQGE